MFRDDEFRNFKSYVLNQWGIKVWHVKRDDGWGISNGVVALYDAPRSVLRFLVESISIVNKK